MNRRQTAVLYKVKISLKRTLYYFVN